MNDCNYDIFFTGVYERNHAYLVKYISLFVHDFAIAEDLAHDVFIKVYRAGKTEADGMSLRGYLKKAAKNMVIDYVRKRKREEAKNRKLIQEITEFNDSFFSDLDNLVIEGEVISTVNDILNVFPERNRRVFKARLLEQKSRKKISEEEKISSYEVKRIEDEIEYFLKSALKRFFYDDF